MCELEERHGVTLGSAYKTETTAREFTHFIAESHRQELVLTLESAKFFSLLLDGSTDAGNLDNELLLVVWCDREGEGECVRTRISYFTVTRPASVSAEGLFDVLGGALQSLGISSITREECSKLVGLGTDGASANIARAGLKRLKGSSRTKVTLGVLDVVSCPQARAGHKGCFENHFLHSD